MADDTWLTPAGDLTAVLRACRVPLAQRTDNDVLADVTLAAAVALDQVEQMCGTIEPPAPAWAKGAALIIAEHYYRTRLGATRTDSTPGSGAGYLVPKAAEEILEPHLSAPLGFA